MNYNLTLRLIKCLVLPTVKRFKSSSKVSEVKMSQVFKQVRNPLTGSMDWDVQHEDYDTFQDIARAAFADMLHDTERNKKYQRALELAIQKMHDQGKPANVLDIGTGTGLLSMMAARSGADSIVACEAFEPMAECCLKILAKNGLADKIKVIPKRSTELTVGEEGDLKQRANILVTEVFDTELIGEGALSTFSHAHKHLLEPDCIVVPDSAVIYAQVVECPTLQKWNKVNDLVDEDLNVVLRTPQKMKDCPETAAVHDIQLSQLPRSCFKLLSEPLPVFYYDWSGKSPVDFNRTVRQSFVVKQTGAGQMVFMWWDLNMDTEGKIVLSCAPWWNHPDVNLEAERPQDTIPWRDHWMQAVYYFPKSVMLNKDTEASLVSCQDEYSLWFYLEDEKTKFKEYKRPACECGFHLTFSRTHISYLNDGTRSKKFLARLKEVLNPNSIVLDLNGSSLMGLAAAKMAKTVYIHEDKKVNLGILNDYCQTNDITNITFIPEITDEIAAQADVIICDPCFKTSIQPWHSLMQYAYTVLKLKPKLKGSVEMVPDSCELWAMPVDFYDLQKIRMPVKKCEGFDMSIFDELVEGARQISDDELDAQPLWEYPCRARGPPQPLLHVDFADVREKYVSDNECPIMVPVRSAMMIRDAQPLWEYPCRARGPPQPLLHVDLADVRERYVSDNECPIMISDDELDAAPLWEYPCRARGPPQPLLHVDLADVRESYVSDNECPIINPPSDKLSSVNGFALWSAWRLGGAAVGAGPARALADAALVRWDSHERQAVQILEKTHVVTKKNKWKYHLTCDLEKGKFSANMKIILPQ